MKTTLKKTLSAALLLAALPSLHADSMKEKIMKPIVCAGGAYGGYKLGGKIADFQAKKLNLNAADAEKQRRAFQIGMALALCGGGVLITNTTFAKLSERDRKHRESELLAAVQESAPRTYTVPDNPNLRGTIRLLPPQVEGNKECRVVEDNLADASQNDSALVKFCRSNGGPWEARKL